MRSLRREYRHTLAGEPVTFDHYAIVNEIFGHKSFLETSPSHLKTKPLSEALEALKAKGLSDKQMKLIEQALTKSIFHVLDAPTKAPTAFKLSYSKQHYLGTTFNNTSPSEDLIEEIKIEFLEALTTEMNWEEEKRSKAQMPTPAELASGRKIQVSIRNI